MDEGVRLGVGLLLCFLSLLSLLGCWVGYIIVAFKKDPAKGLLCLAVPLYIYYYAWNFGQKSIWLNRILLASSFSLLVGILLIAEKEESKPLGVSNSKRIEATACIHPSSTKNWNIAGIFFIIDPSFELI